MFSITGGISWFRWNWVLNRRILYKYAVSGQQLERLKPKQPVGKSEEEGEICFCERRHGNKQTLEKNMSNSIESKMDRQYSIAE